WGKVEVFGEPNVTYTDTRAARAMNDQWLGAHRATTARTESALVPLRQLRALPAPVEPRIALHRNCGDQRTIMADWQEIAKDPTALGGKPITRGVRLDVEFIIDLLARAGPIQGSCATTSE
ncbi:MAG: hypothetical protein ACK2U9_01395, partial [Anaerolineae bacterium]